MPAKDVQSVEGKVTFHIGRKQMIRFYLPDKIGRENVLRNFVLWAGVSTRYYHRAMTPTEYAIYCSAQQVGQRCIALYLWGKGECQWAKHWQSVDGQWEWHFWNVPCLPNTISNT